jgi:hypothetical protein
MSAELIEKLLNDEASRGEEEIVDIAINETDPVDPRGYWST